MCDQEIQKLRAEWNIRNDNSNDILAILENLREEYKRENQMTHAGLGLLLGILWFGGTALSWFMFGAAVGGISFVALLLVCGYLQANLAHGRRDHIKELIAKNEFALNQEKQKLHSAEAALNRAAKK